MVMNRYECLYHCLSDLCLFDILADYTIIRVSIFILEELQSTDVFLENSWPLKYLKTVWLKYHDFIGFVFESMEFVFLKFAGALKCKA